MKQSMLFNNLNLQCIERTCFRISYSACAKTKLSKAHSLPGSCRDVLL